MKHSHMKTRGSTINVVLSLTATVNIGHLFWGDAKLIKQVPLGLRERWRGTTAALNCDIRIVKLSWDQNPRECSLLYVNSVFMFMDAIICREISCVYIHIHELGQLQNYLEIQEHLYAKA